jgi:transposase-like protein
MKTRRKFDKEFKLMTVELSKSRENLVDLAEELDIKVGLIYRWRREFLDKGEGQEYYQKQSKAHCGNDE